MKIDIKESRTKNGTVTFTLSGDFIINTVKALKEKVEGDKKDYHKAVFDLSGVSKMDTAGYQLLLYFKREMEKSNMNFVISEKSPEIDRIFSLYGSLK